MRASLAEQVPALLAQCVSYVLARWRSFRSRWACCVRIDALAGQPLAVLHFDAHYDTWEDHFGEPSGHGTWVYEAITEGLVDPESFVQVGIRSAGVREGARYVRDQGGVIFTARDLRGFGIGRAVVR